MSLDLIRHFESEAEGISAKMKSLQERSDLVATILKELRAAAGKSGRKAATPAAKPAKKTAAKKAPGRKKRGGVTVRDAIVKAVTGGGKAMTAGEIIGVASDLSGGAVASIRTQINTLTKEGALKQVPYAGRGFKYALGGGKKAPAKKAARRKKKK